MYIFKSCEPFNEVAKSCDNLCFTLNLLDEDTHFKSSTGDKKLAKEKN